MHRPLFGAASAVAISSLFLIAAGTNVASAADVRLFCAGALQPAVRELLLKFEQSSGHKVTATYQAVGVLTDRIQKGFEYRQSNRARNFG